jgi:eukaryotic-like serine/threonine-protein kinase
LDLNRGDGAKAIERSQTAKPYELGEGIGSLNFVCVLPAYLRGEAYLAAKQAPEAAAEFQEILDNRGLVANCWTAPFARLGLARAKALGGDSAGARTAYQDLFAIWKQSDTDLPPLGQARAEYEKLK